MKKEMDWTKKVQLWKNGVMMTAQLKPEEAERMVKEGVAKRINDQAIVYVGETQ